MRSDLEKRRAFLQGAVELLVRYEHLGHAQVVRGLLAAIDSHYRTNRGAVTISNQRLYRAAGLMGDTREAEA